MNSHELLTLALPTIAAIATSWMATWYFKRLWRSAHPEWTERLKDFHIIIVAFCCGAMFGVFYQWVFNDYISNEVGYDLDMMKAAAVCVVISAFASPWLFGILLWFVLTPIDFKVWKKPSWGGLYDFLNVPHRRNVNYDDGKSDLTRFAGDQDRRKSKKPVKADRRKKD